MYSQFNLGEFDYTFMDEAERGLPKPKLFHLLFIIIMIYFMLILVNLLIALMGDIYVRVHEDADGSFMFELGDLVRNLESYIPKTKLAVKG